MMRKLKGESQHDFLLSVGSPLLVIGTFAIPMRVFRVGAFTVSDMVLLCASLLVLLSTGPRRPAPRAMVFAVLVGAIAVALASMRAESAVDSLSVGLRLLFVWVIWQSAMRKWADSGHRLETIASAFVLGSAASGIMGVVQSVWGVTIPGSGMAFGRVAGLETHVNGQGGVMAVAITLALGLLMSGVRPFLHSLCLLCCVTGVLLAGSVSGMVGSAAGIVAVLFFHRAQFSKMALTGLLVAMVLPLGLGVLSQIPGVQSPMERILDTTGGGSDEATLYLRYLTVLSALDHIRTNPLVGVGLDPASGGTYDGSTQTHNLLLLVWMQGGLLLLIALLAVLGCAVRALRRNTRIPLVTTLSAAMVAALVFAMSGPVLLERWFWLPVVLSLALPDDHVELWAPE